MKLKTKNILTSNAPLKAISLILGYTFWHIFGAAHVKTIELNVPLCFHSTPANHIIKAPNTINVQLMGKRTYLYALDHNTLAVHINAHNVHTGTNPIKITSDNLFLPETVKLVHYIPCNLEVTIE